MDPIYGCESCRTTVGRAGCAVHRDLSPSPGANLYITNCIHGLDLRLHPRCYLCRPVLPPWPTKRLSAETLADAMDSAYDYEHDEYQPDLPFVDDIETFWKPFAEKVLAYLGEH